jgi:transcriptional regulator with XRE-family HTH domain
MPLRGDRLKQLRTQARMSQATMARVLNIGKSQPGRLENAPSDPQVGVVEHLALLFGVSADWLLGLSNDRHVLFTPDALARREVLLKQLSDPDREALTLLLDDRLRAVVKAFADGDPERARRFFKDLFDETGHRPDAVDPGDELDPRQGR